MQRPSLKIYIILSLVLIVVVVLFLILSARNSRQQQTITSTPTPAPISDTYPTPSLIPETIVPTETGGLSGGFDQEEQRTAQQIQDLSYQVPLSEPLFDIDFNWEEYKFVITLKEPKNQARLEFNQWLQANYPAITEEHLIIN